MKVQVRRSIFETNSSSVHSITMVAESEFDKWKDGELFYDKENCELVSKEDIKEIIVDAKNHAEKYDYDFDESEYDVNSETRYKRFLTYDEFNDWEHICYETFEDSYKTKNGEVVVAFGYFGHD